MPDWSIQQWHRPSVCDRNGYAYGYHSAEYRHPDITVITVSDERDYQLRPLLLVYSHYEFHTPAVPEPPLRPVRRLTCKNGMPILMNGASTWPQHWPHSQWVTWAHVFGWMDLKTTGGIWNLHPERGGHLWHEPDDDDRYCSMPQTVTALKSRPGSRRHYCRLMTYSHHACRQILLTVIITGCGITPHHPERNAIMRII